MISRLAGAHASTMKTAFRLNVLNPGGRDPEQHFGGDSLGETAHAPVNFHAYAACTGGSFYRDTARAVAAKGPVLLLLRGDFRESERALALLKKAGVPVAVSLKETGLHQIAQQLRDAGRLSRFFRIVAEADACIAPTPEAADIFRTVKNADERVAFIPTPYPLHESRWDLSRPRAERHGIFIGTREWDVPSRNHAAALLAAQRISKATGEALTVFDFDGRTGARLLAELRFGPGELRILTKRMPYADYLRVVAEHKIVFQLDTSFVPGQVAGDALLARIPCVGGNGAIERIAFAELNGANPSIAELTDIAIQLLRDESRYRSAAELTVERLSFQHVAHELEHFVNSLG
ncbi:MAG: hypothetical protein M3Z22_08760 [Verrucomicrobiota bacterium]|nr:hypothetical protein [Verrucomicrobiota bacterium]